MSREIDVGLRTVQRWAAAESPVPAWLMAKLPALALAKINQGVATDLERRAATIRAFAKV